MEDVDELRRALKAAELRAFTAEAFAGQAEARIGELEDELRRLQEQKQAKPKASAPTPTLPDDRATLVEILRRAREWTTDYASPFVVDESPRLKNPPRPRLRVSGPRRVTLHYQADNGSVMLRAETGVFNKANDSAEYICMQIDRHERRHRIDALVTEFVHKLDRARRMRWPSAAVRDITLGIERVLANGKDYTVVIE